jgi:hypothetical protein
MSTRVVVAWVLSGLALSSYAATPSGCSYTPLAIQTGLRSEKKQQQAARKNLVEQLACLREQELALKPPTDGVREDGKREEDVGSEIKTLENIAIDDLQRLADLRASLEKVQESGVDVVAPLTDTLNAINDLSPVVVVTNGKPGLKSGRFTDDRTLRETTKAGEDCLNTNKPPSIKETSDVQRCVDALNDKIANAGSYEAKCLRARLETVEDLGARLAEKKAKQLLQVSQKHDAAKTAMDKAAVDALQTQKTQLQQDLDVLNEIAVVPSSRRSCLTNDAVPHLQDAAGVLRCLDAVDLKIVETRLKHLPPQHDHEGGVAGLRVVRARIEDEKVRFDRFKAAKERLDEQIKEARNGKLKRLEDQLERLKLEMPNVMELNNVPAGCGAGPVCHLSMANDDVVLSCLAALDREIESVDQRRAAAAAALDAALDPYLVRRAAIEDRGSRIADQRRADLAALKAKIAAAKDDTEKAPLLASQNAANAEVIILDDIATRPSLERRCIDDPHFNPKDESSAALCMILVSTRIEETKIANPQPHTPSAVATLVQLDRQLKRLDLVRRRIAAEAAAAPTPASTQATDSDTKKSDVTTTTKQNAPSNPSPDVSALVALATLPIARESCVSDPNSHLKIVDGFYVERCIAALTAAIEDLEQDREEEPVDPRQRDETTARLTKQVARFQEAGRHLLTLKLANVATLQAKHDATQSDSERAQIDNDEKPLKAEVAALRKVVIEPGADPQTEFADYEQWFTKLSLGYEYAGATNAFSKGFPRIGATLGFHYPGQSEPDIASRWHWYGVYNSFTLWLTNSAESQTDLATQFVPAASTSQVRALDDTGGTTTPAAATTPAPITRAVEFENQFFVPIWRNDFQQENPRLRTVIGPLLVFGARKLDSESFAHDRLYIGLRNARSPDTFYDILFGRTNGLVSRRVELRGQYSLPYIFKNNARIAVGGVGNFGINKARFVSCDEASPHCRAEEPDSIRFYLSYDIAGNDFLKFFGAKAPSQ